MGHEPEGQGYDRLPDKELWDLYHDKDPKAYAELWSRSSAQLTHEAIVGAGGDEVHARAALQQTRDRLGRYETQANYDPKRPWIEWATELLKEAATDLALQDLPDEELQRRYHEGDPAAFRALLFIRHRSLLVRHAWKLSFHDEEIQDEILCETHARLIRPKAYESYDHTQPWLPWAKQVMHRVAISLHRKRSRHNIPPMPFDPNLVAAPVHLDLEALRRALDGCLQSLSQNERILFVLHFIEGMNWCEAAETLGHVPSWATKNKYRALSKLRNCLEQKGYTDEN